MNPITIALRNKGPSDFLRRSARIAGRYGWTSRKMDDALAEYVTVLDSHDCRATFPITSVALQRNPHTIRQYVARGIEFAVHGYRHIDYTQLTVSDQRSQLQRASQAFSKVGIQPDGHRSPYLRWDENILASLQHQGFLYDSSQALVWDVAGEQETPAYQHVLSFYKAKSATDYPSLPRLEDNFVHIPYSLPDDEAMLERLALRTREQMSELWAAILQRTHQLGELFVLGLHPERIATCQEALSVVLAEARSYTPDVWIARLDEIAVWWRDRAGTAVKISENGGGSIELAVTGPSRTTVFARSCSVCAPTLPWADGYRRVESTTFTVQSSVRPFIGLSPDVSPKLAEFLRQQGYISQVSKERHMYSIYLDWTQFSAKDERPLLNQIEETDGPLVRLGRWPNSARCALAITGDIDALTLRDFGLRYLGR
jgi:peptidoglycan/xylan/chitin deacetylase (PgdA/CDA1 family)